MFSLISAWTNGWANNQGAVDFRRNCPHYDGTLMTRVWGSKFFGCRECWRTSYDLDVLLRTVMMSCYEQPILRNMAYKTTSFHWWTSCMQVIWRCDSPEYHEYHEECLKRICVLLAHTPLKTPAVKWMPLFVPQSKMYQILKVMLTQIVLIPAAKLRECCSN